ncbi:MAG: Ig domain-containing protein, partial [Chromatiales bacterium]|nr:Ig domain-containing protein [Chromatiales bacterium]
AATVPLAVEVEVTGGATPLSLTSPGKQSLVVGTFDDELFPAATGGVAPYTYTFTCAGGSLPPGMGFAPATHRFAGTPTVRFRDSCTYTVTDSAQPAATVPLAVEVEVTGGATPLMLAQVFEDTSDNELTLNIGRRSRTTFREASGGVTPYTYELADCTLPAGIEFHPSTRVLSGTPDAEYRGPNCTYRVTDSADPEASVSLSFELTVEPLEESAWRFRTRTVEPGGPCADPTDADPVMVATMPAAHAGAGDAIYALPGAPNPAATGSNLSFDPGNRVLTYANPDPPPVLGTPDTYRYLVGTETTGVNAENAEDALCLDVQYVPRSENCDERPPLTRIQILLQVRDDAFWDENANEYRCPDTIAPTPRSGARGSPSNPVHEALGPVHARRASAVAHAAVRDRVLGWSPGEEQASFAITPEVGLASLSGRSEGFGYSGTSESASFGAETGAGAWQAGLVASFTRTELHYRAEASLAEHGYVAGEHHTEVLSLHPFVAWHAPSGGHVRASMGAGTGELRHRDDHGFPSWSRSDVHLQSWTAGASVPVADVLTGELQVEAGIESFSFDIEGGGRISSSLPTLRGRDWRAGLAWSAPVPGAPSLSVAWRRLTGDGPEGGRLEARGSVSVEGVFAPRLALLANAEGSFGLGDLDHDSWGLAGGVRFAPDASRRGFGLELDTRLAPLEEGGSAGVGIRAEAGYGLWGGPLFGTLRPHVGLIRHPGGGFLRRSVGVDLRDTPYSRARIEVHDHAHDRAPALRFTLRQRF